MVTRRADDDRDGPSFRRQCANTLQAAIAHAMLNRSSAVRDPDSQPPRRSRAHAADVHDRRPRLRNRAPAPRAPPPTARRPRQALASASVPAARRVRPERPAEEGDIDKRLITANKRRRWRRRRPAADESSRWNASRSRREPAKQRVDPQQADVVAEHEVDDVQFDLPRARCPRSCSPRPAARPTT